MKITTGKPERNYGIDALRILTMLFVIVLHILGQGGVLKATQTGSSQFAAGWMLEAFAYCAVNCFALISGYVGYTPEEKGPHISAYLQLWLRVVFYGLLTCLIFCFAVPGSVTKHQLTSALFPVAKNTYWYFTAYTGLVLVIPLLNAAVKSLSERTLKYLFLCVFLVFGCFETATGIHAGGEGVFHLKAGYCFTWLVLIYLLGAIIKKCNFGKNTSVRKSLISIAVLLLITWAWKLLAGDNKWAGVLIKYTSPTILGMSVFYLFLFAKLQFSPKLQKVIRFAAPTVFSAYLINTQPLFWKYIMKNRFVFLATENAALLIPAVLAIAAAFVFCVVFVDKARELLFRLLRVKKLTLWLEQRVNWLLEKL